MGNYPKQKPRKRGRRHVADEGEEEQPYVKREDEPIGDSISRVEKKES